MRNDMVNKTVEETRVMIEEEARKLAPEWLTKRRIETLKIENELNGWLDMFPALGYVADRSGKGIVLKSRSPAFNAAMKLEAVIRFFVASPLTILLLGLAILIGGSVVCEYHMATKGLGTEAYLPYSRMTMFFGGLLWLFYLAKCLDLRSLGAISYYEYQPKVLKCFWIASFICSTLACESVLSLVVSFETEFIKRNPALFFWRSEMITQTLAHNKLDYILACLFFCATAVLSCFAVVDDLRREMILRIRSSKLNYHERGLWFLYEDDAVFKIYDPDHLTSQERAKKECEERCERWRREKKEMMDGKGDNANVNSGDKK